MEGNKKFTLTEIIFILFPVVAVDLFELFSGFLEAVPFLGQAMMLISHITSWIVLFVIQFWLIMKGVRGLWALAGNLIEFIPFINMLPWRTVGLIITIILANRPELQKIAGAAQLTGGTNQIKLPG